MSKQRDVIALNIQLSVATGTSFYGIIWYKSNIRVEGSTIMYAQWYSSGINKSKM